MLTLVLTQILCKHIHLTQNLVEKILMLTQVFYTIIYYRIKKFASSKLLIILLYINQNNYITSIYSYKIINLLHLLFYIYVYNEEIILYLYLKYSL